ncbi:TPA: phosphoethanolamine transferase, partial [Haemophilus influenzae]
MFVFSKYRITKILVSALFAISVVVNNVHYAVYQSWIGPVSYSLAFKEINEITNAGLTMIDKFIYPLLFGLFEVAVFLSLSFIKRKIYKFSWIFDFIFYAAMMYVFVRA